jgi:hypothetical protein
MPGGLGNILGNNLRRIPISADEGWQAVRMGVQLKACIGESWRPVKWGLSLFHIVRVAVAGAYRGYPLVRRCRHNIGWRHGLRCLARLHHICTTSGSKTW